MTDLIRKPANGTLVDAAARFPHQPPATDVYDQEQDTAVLDSARQALEGAALDAPAEPSAAKTVDLPEDHEGDRPLRPLWTRDAKSLAAASRRTRIRARRAARRWAGRQLTHRGHAAQAVRGIRLTHEWVHGFHGIHVQAAKHAAHTATRDARTATRRARFTMMPKERDVAQKQALTAQAAALDAVKLHKDARDRVRRGRLFRGAIAYGTPLALNGAAAMETGWLGLAGTALATLAATAFIGRHPLTGETWDPERRSLGDGDPLTESMLDRAFTAAKIIAGVQRLRMVSPCAIDPDQQNAWMALIDLPDGVTVDKVRTRHVELAAALGIDRSQLDLQQAGSDGRLALWACGTDPFINTRKSPLIGRTEPLNTWKDGVPIAFDKRGRIIHVTISDYSMIFAGATRSGKGMALANLLAGVMLDPRVRIRLFDGKGSGEYVPFAKLLATFVRRNPQRLRDFLRVMVGEMNDRTEILVEMGVSKADESLLEKLGGIELVVVDELATYTAKEGPSKEYAEEITELLAQIAAVGASVGIVLALATQFPEVGIVPSRLRGNCSGRLANRTETPTASNVILGDGMVGEGYDSSKIPNAKTSRGRGWLTTPDTGVIEVRSLFIDEKTREIVPLIATGVEIRRKAGCLPGHYADPVEKELLRITGANSAAGGPTGHGGIQRGTLLDHLVTAANQTGRGSLTSAEVFTALADVDRARYARNEGEADAAWASRAGKAFKAQLTELGVEMEPTRVAAADGSRPNGYTLAALQTAADTARNARK